MYENPGEHDPRCRRPAWLHTIFLTVQ